jgi:hypothetical protein
MEDQTVYQNSDGNIWKKRRSSGPKFELICAKSFYPINHCDVAEYETCNVEDPVNSGGSMRLSITVVISSVP